MKRSRLNVDISLYAECRSVISILTGPHILFTYIQIYAS